MTLRARLEGLLATRGVRSVAVSSNDGFLLESVGGDDADGEFVAGMIASSLASGQALAELFGDGAVRQATIEYERGPVVLLPMPDDAEGHVLVAVLDDAAALGRVRLALRRALPELAQEVTT
ncbi:MAG: roadblock/LC7 domain-containing protein [Trueperaceae bacterium]|nr:roadblock/LC7 domain-containing protein [Trueperaceae bacterium]